MIDMWRVFEKWDKCITKTIRTIGKKINGIIIKYTTTIGIKTRVEIIIVTGRGEMTAGTKVIFIFL